MCGRYTNHASWAEVLAFSQPLQLAVADVPIEPRYNIAPSQSAWVLAADGEGGAKAGRMQWGLVPHWADNAKGGYSTINARAETVASKPAFRESFKRRRCLVIASGYYEWLPLPDGRKQPYYIHPTDAPVMLMAGLWDRWQAPGGEPLLSFSIITERARGDMRQLHDRRPVRWQGESLQLWLYAPASDAQAMLQAVPEPALHWHAVHPGVGNARSEGERLIAPLA